MFVFVDDIWLKFDWHVIRSLAGSDKQKKIKAKRAYWGHWRSLKVTWPSPCYLFSLIGLTKVAVCWWREETPWKRLKALCSFCWFALTRLINFFHVSEENHYIRKSFIELRLQFILHVSIHTVCVNSKLYITMVTSTRLSLWLQQELDWVSHWRLGCPQASGNKRSTEVWSCLYVCMCVCVWEGWL